jgi:nicotinate-nucleotide adenylyltransferase
VSNDTERLLIFGGSFDPVHNGHLFIAELAARHIQAERVLFLPTRRAPHRAPLTAPVDERLAMLRMAIASNPRFAIDTTDLEDEASGYTVDILPKLQKLYAPKRLSFLVGEDAVTRNIWHRFDDVVASVERFLVAPRDVADAIESPALSALLASLIPQTRERIELLPSPRVTISSTAIRERIAAGTTVRYLLPDAVLRYIEERQLYLGKGTTCQS